jgi:NAD(P)-dependent dehydrogenase (short-subunit alcohol dehydrogenase family)
MNLGGSSAIVVGGASGMGAATARLLVARGAQVVVADLDDDLGGQVAQEIGGRQEPLSNDGDRGAIVLTASRAGWRGEVGASAYSAANSGLFGLTRTLAVELAHRGIRVNLIAPGGFDTRTLANAHSSESIIAGEIERAAFPKRLGAPEEFATLAVELVTNGYVNGALVPIDAGAAR